MTDTNDDRFGGEPYDDVLDVDGTPIEPTDLDERLRELGVIEEPDAEQ